MDPHRLLAAVSITPFSTMLMGQFITYRVALAVYWLNILFLGGTLLRSWLHACAARLAKPEVTETVDRAKIRPIVITQAIHAAGAALCVITPTSPWPPSTRSSPPLRSASIGGRWRRGPSRTPRSR